MSTVADLVTPPHPGAGRARSVGILSTFPPTACGIATFSSALARGLQSSGAHVAIVRVADGGRARVAPLVGPVVGELHGGSTGSVAAAAERLSRCDVAVVQHEYGLYGGADGDEVLDVLAALHVPSIVVAHTVLNDPTPHQRSILVAAARLARRLVVMSHAARQRLCARYDVAPEKVTVIPHGAAVPTRAPAPPRGRPTLLTWGLIGPGKGITRVIDAMPALQRLRPRPRYLVAGQTHPKVLAKDGEAYRDARIAQAQRLGVAGSVSFDDDYRDVTALTTLIQSCAVVVLPYDSREQATSGVLVDSVAAGRPVIATAFPHAVELLASGAGIVVDHDDPEAMARALHAVLTRPELAAGMAAEAARLAPSMSWPVVAGRYLALAEDLVGTRVAVA